jgi:hypothetical protein
VPRHSSTRATAFITINGLWIGTGHVFDINVIKPVFLGSAVVGFYLAISRAEILAKLEFLGLLPAFCRPTRRAFGEAALA